MPAHVANIQPFPVKLLDHQQAITNNLVCNRQLKLQSQIHGTPWILSLTPFTHEQPFDFELQLNIDGIPARVQLSRELFRDIAIGSIPLSDLLDQLPDDLRNGCTMMALEHLFADLGSVLQKEVRLQRISHCEHIAQGTSCLGLGFQSGERSVGGLLVMNDQLHNLLQGDMSTAMTPPADGIAMPLSIEVGHTVIADQRLQQLTTGDIVLMDRCWYRDKKHVLLRLSPHNGYLCSLEENKITLKQLTKQSLESGMSDDFDDFDDLDDDLDLGDDFDTDDYTLDQPVAGTDQNAGPVEQPMSTPSSPPPQQADHKDILGLPVKLVFDIGHHELTVGDMGHIGPGYTFELNRDITSPVTMKANGKPFAECELVSINNQLGARIVRLL